MAVIKTNCKKCKELEVELAKQEARLEGYKSGKSVDYTKYIVMGIAAVEGLVLVLERLL